MFMDPKLAKKVVKAYADNFKNLLNERSSYGLLGNFDLLTAMEILKDLDRHHNNINETSTGLFLAKLLLYIIIHSTIITKGRV